MPTHTIHCILTKMYYDCNEAPWNFDTWKELTGVRHGLFPKDDEQLPANWTRQTSNEIGSYFDQFRALRTEDQKSKFSSANGNSQMVPGRQAWRDWVTKGWKKWKIHNRIIDVLLAEELHPYTLAAETNSWPDATQWVPLAIDPVGTALFGEQCYSPGKERVDPALRPTIGALITRTWIALYTSFNRSKARIDLLESEAIKAFEALDQDKLTKAKIKVAIVKVMKWKQVAEVLQMADKEEMIKEMESELERLMVGLDKKVKPTSGKASKTLCRVTTDMLKSLASKEDIDDVVNLYAECFKSSGGDPTQLEEQVSSINLKFGSSLDGADPGVEIEGSMPPSLLANALGFANVPLLFNTHRHQSGMTPWEDPVGFQNAPNEEFTATRLRWHQLAGVHGARSQLPSALGCLLQTKLECVGRQERGIDPFPLLAKNPYLGECKAIPNKSHLILVPGTILGQWQLEVKTALNPKAFDLFVYTTGQAFRNEFWSDEGPFAKSRQQPVNKVILASHSALLQDYRLLFRASKSKGLPWQPPKRVVAFDSIFEKTLFGLDYLSVTIDEAHGFRNVGRKHSAALAILEKARIRLIMTATPLQTSTKDLASMARLVGIEYFFTQSAFDEEKADTVDIRRAKASLGEDYNPLDVQQKDEDPIRQTQAQIAHRIQMQFEHRVLRRTTESKSWEGQSLVKLPKLHEHVVLLTLQPFEQEIHFHLTEKMRDDLSSCSSMKIFSSTFYLPSRMGAIYPRRSLTEKIPHFKTLEEWQSRKSTKIDTCARMCRHLLSRDDAPDMTFKDGQVVFPDVPQPRPGEEVAQERKILIYQEFPSFGPLLRNVLTLYNIGHLFIDGRTSYDCRAKTVSQFMKDPSSRVLIFSSVGSSGLNLSKATVVIFLDQPWSAQDERQIRGRAYRQPQEKEVHCFHLLADETSDVILSALARGKKDMLETFLQRPEGQEMLALMTQGVIPDEDSFGLDKIAKEPMRNAPKQEPCKTGVDFTESLCKDERTVYDEAKNFQIHLTSTGQSKQGTYSISNTHEIYALTPENDGPTSPHTPDANGANCDWSNANMASEVTISNTLEMNAIPGRDRPSTSSTNSNRDVDMVAYSEVMDSVAEPLTMPSPPFIPCLEDAPQTPPSEAEIGHRRGRPQYRQEHESPEAQKASKRPRVSSPSGKDCRQTAGGGRLTPDSDIEILGEQVQTNMVPREIRPIPRNRIKDITQPGHRPDTGSDSEDERALQWKDKSTKETPQVVKRKLVSESWLGAGFRAAAPTAKKYDIPTNIRQPTMLWNSGTLSPPPRSTPSQNPFRREGKRTK